MKLSRETACLIVDAIEKAIERIGADFDSGARRQLLDNLQFPPSAAPRVDVRLAGSGLVFGISFCPGWHWRGKEGCRNFFSFSMGDYHSSAESHEANKEKVAIIQEGLNCLVELIMLCPGLLEV